MLTKANFVTQRLRPGRFFWSATGENRRGCNEFRKWGIAFFARWRQLEGQ